MLPGGCRLQKLERWIVEADQKLVGRHDFLVDKGGRLPRNGTSQIAKDHDCNDEQGYWEMSCRNELSIFNYSKGPDSVCVCEFCLICSSEYAGNEKISTEIRCWFRPKS